MRTFYCKLCFYGANKWSKFPTDETVGAARASNFPRNDGFLVSYRIFRICDGNFPAGRTLSDRLKFRRTIPASCPLPGRVVRLSIVKLCRRQWYFTELKAAAQLNRYHYHWHKRTTNQCTELLALMQCHLLYNKLAPIAEDLLTAPASQAYVEIILQPVWLDDCWSSQQNETVSWTPRLPQVKFPYMTLEARSTIGWTEWTRTKS